MTMGCSAKPFPSFRTMFAVAAAVCLAMPAGAKPHRIVSTNVCADQLVMLLADPQDIVSVSRLAREPEISNFATQAARLPTNNARAEEIVELQPDLVVGDIQTGKQANRLARSIGVPVHLIDWPSSIADVRKIILAAGGVLDQQAKADGIVADMDRRIAAAAEERGIAVTALVYEPNGMTTGTGTLTADILASAGLTNLAPGLTSSSYSAVPLERVITAAPQLLILDDAYTGSSSRAQALLKHPAFRALKGRTRIYRMPSRLWICPGPWIAEAVERLGAARGTLPGSLAPH